MKEARGKNLNFKLPVVVIDFGINLNFFLRKRKVFWFLISFLFGFSQANFLWVNLYTLTKAKERKQNDDDDAGWKK